MFHFTARQMFRFFMGQQKLQLIKTLLKTFQWKTAVFEFSQKTLKMAMFRQTLNVILTMFKAAFLETIFWNIELQIRTETKAKLKFRLLFKTRKKASALFSKAYMQFRQWRICNLLEQKDATLETAKFLAFLFQKIKIFKSRW